jgi:drug/metabolite transporter (DMT)-like permease
LEQFNAKQARTGLAALALASAIWGGMYVASDALMQTMAPLVALEYREAISAFVLITYSLLTKRFNFHRQDFLKIALVGIIGFTASIGLQFEGTHLAGAGMGSLITSTSPVIIAVISMAWYHERVPLRRIGAILLAVAGIAVIVGKPAPGDRDLIYGVMLLLAAAIAWSVYTLMSSELVKRYDPLSLVGVTSLVGAITSLPFALLEAPYSRTLVPDNFSTWFEVLYISLFGMAVAFVLWNWGFKHVSTSKGGVMLVFQPMVGIVLGSVILGEHLGIATLIGAVLSITGLVLVVTDNSARSPLPQESV